MNITTALEGYWLARRRDLSPNTVNDYSVTFRRFETFVGERPITAIVARDIHRFLNETQTQYGISNKTLSNAWCALSSFWTWAELGIAHPMRGVVRRPKFRRKPIPPYNETEIRALLAACDHAAAWTTCNGHAARNMRPTALRDQAILLVLVDTGLRASELCNLLVEDYAPQPAKLTVRHGKGDKERAVCRVVSTSVR